MSRKKLGCSWVPEFIFHDCCVWHDEQYDRIRYGIYEGVMKRANRKEVDCFYLNRMLDAIDDHGKYHAFYTFIAYTYYYGVRLFGGFTI